MPQTRGAVVLIASNERGRRSDRLKLRNRVFVPGLCAASVFLEKNIFLRESGGLSYSAVAYHASWFIKVGCADRSALWSRDG